MFVRALAVCGLTAALSGQQPPSPPRLLADINRAVSIAGSSNPATFADVGAAMYFVAEDGLHGRELFRTLGTGPTTAMVADIHPGPIGSAPALLTPLGGRLLFFANDGVHGMEPWVSDGTAAGTQLVADIVPGLNGPGVLAARTVGNRVVFFCNALGGVEPWATDGSAGGTARLADIASGPASSVDAAILPAAVVHTDARGVPVLDFVARTTSRYELWRTDGTPAGTHRIADLVDGRTVAAFGTGVALDNGRIVFPGFFVQNSTVDHAVWSSDGTAAGTVVIARPGGFGPFLSGGVTFAGEAYFGGYGTGSVFATDGTAAGSRLLSLGSGTTQVTPYFLGEKHSALWFLYTIGTRSGLARIDPGSSAAVPTGELPFAPIGSPYDVARGTASIGSRFLLAGRTSASALWSMEPATRTAVELTQTDVTTALQIGLVTGRAFFPSSNALTGVEPWSTDGTAAGTSLLRDLNTVPSTRSGGYSSGAHAFAPLGRRVLFGATSLRGSEVWITDGTPGGTTLVTNGVEIDGSIVTAGHRAFFRGITSATGSELWVSDGTATGTRMVHDLRPGPLWGTRGALTALGSEVVFLAAGSTTYWIAASDGTSIRHLLAVPGGTFEAGWARAGDRVYLLTNRVVSGAPSIARELWVTDGTAAGSARVVSLAASPGGAGLAAFGDRVWFVADDPVAGTELFSSDGSAGGTAPVGTLAPGPETFSVHAVVRARSRLFLATQDRIWVVDDEAVGPVAVPLPAGVQLSRLVASFVPFGDAVIFDAWRASDGTRVWITDGTTTGTRPLSPQALRFPTGDGYAIAGERFVFFRLVDPVTQNVETWVTDGTTTGTSRYAGSLSWEFSPSGVDTAPHLANGRMFVAALDPVAGVEPHVIDVGGTSEIVGAGCGGVDRRVELHAATPPVLGARCELVGRSSVGAAAVVLMSSAPIQNVPFPAAGRCELYVDANAFAHLGPLAVTGASFRQPIDVPPSAALQGLQVTLQAIVGPTDAALGFDLSNGVLLTIGR